MFLSMASIFDRDVAPFNVTKFFEAELARLDPWNTILRITR